MNFAVFLDDVTEFNGPLYIIPRSHRQVVIEARRRRGTFRRGLQVNLKRLAVDRNALAVDGNLKNPIINLEIIFSARRPARR